MQNETLVFAPSLVFIIRRVDQNDPKQPSTDARSIFFFFYLKQSFITKKRKYKEEKESTELASKLIYN